MHDEGEHTAGTGCDGVNAMSSRRRCDFHEHTDTRENNEGDSKT